MSYRGQNHELGSISGFLAFPEQNLVDLGDFWVGVGFSTKKVPIPLYSPYIPLYSPYHAIQKVRYRFCVKLKLFYFNFYFLPQTGLKVVFRKLDVFRGSLSNFLEEKIFGRGHAKIFIPLDICKYTLYRAYIGPIYRPYIGYICKCRGV